ncbi:MAG: rubredoxin [Methanoregula sp.]|jgi:rubredoxin
MAKAVPGKKTAAKKATKPAAAKKNPLTTIRKKTVRAARPVAKKAAAPKKKAAAKGGPKKGKTEVVRYKCRLCGYIYSPLIGEPHNGIPAGTAFEDVPDDYVCPICGQQGKGRIGKWGFEEWRPTRYACLMCNYVYDEKRGEPHRGIKPGTKFEDLPDDYVCPVCALDPKISLQFGKVRKNGFGPLNI